MTLSLWGVLIGIIGFGVQTMASFLAFGNPILTRKLDRIGLPMIAVAIVVTILGLFLK